MSVSSADSGGLGGARVGEGTPEALAGVRGRVVLVRSSRPTSVGSGVKIETFSCFLTSSTLPGASLLCALENEGYEETRASPNEDRRSISGTAIVAFFPGSSVRSTDDRAGRRESDARSPLRSLLVEARLRCSFPDDLCRSLSLSFDLLRSLLSRSFLRRYVSSSREGMSGHSGEKRPSPLQLSQVLGAASNSMDDAIDLEAVCEQSSGALAAPDL